MLRWLMSMKMILKVSKPLGTWTDPELMECFLNKCGILNGIFVEQTWNFCWTFMEYFWNFLNISWTIIELNSSIKIPIKFQLNTSSVPLKFQLDSWISSRNSISSSINIPFLFHSSSKNILFLSQYHSRLVLEVPQRFQSSRSSRSSSSRIPQIFHKSSSSTFVQVPSGLLTSNCGSNDT